MERAPGDDDRTGSRPLPLVGRDEDLARLQRLIDPARKTGEGLVVLGAAGLGKTTLLDVVASRAAVSGWIVLRLRGGRTETDLAFAGLHQLVRPVLDRSSELPSAQRAALLGALGLEAAVHDSGSLLRVGVATLALLSAVAAESPVLLVVDDCQWVDSATLDLLAFVVRRTVDEPVVLVAGARGSQPPRAFAPLPRHELEPLSRRTSGRLLDTLRSPPRGPDRQAVLSQAAGNPLALLEFSRAVAATPGAARHWASEPLPLTERLKEVYGSEIQGLPASTRRALLLTAVAEAGDSAVLVAATAGVQPDDWRPAEEAGLVVVDEIVRFRHPLIRAAVYRSAPYGQRRDAHLVVAGLLEEHPTRQAWHLAAATLHPEDEIAARLDDCAVQSSRLGAHVEAARGFERAAELSTSAPDRARRYVAAAEAALGAGDAGWVQELVTRVTDTTQDAGLLRRAAHVEAAALSTTLDHGAARVALARSMRGSLVDDPGMFLSSLTTAGLLAVYTGDSEIRRDVVAFSAEFDAQTSGTQLAIDPVVRAARLWVDAGTAPVDRRGPLVEMLTEQAEGVLTPDIESLLGGTALVLDEVDLSLRLYTAAADRARVARDAAISVATLTGLLWTCVDAGRWDEALVIAAEAGEVAVAGRQEMHLVAVEAAEATVAALRGQVDLARSLIDLILTRVDPTATAGVLSRVRYASGLAAKASGDHALAYAELASQFDEAGAPHHYHRSWYVLADLAAAGARAGLAAEASQIVERAVASLTGTLQPRLARQVDRARGLLAGDAGEPFFRRAVAVPGAQVPFELAQARLDYGEWLRRRRRSLEARPLLEAARAEFDRLGARPWSDRAAAELRASGVRQADRARDAFSQLTPQQQQIARLAASGLTNREIGERLFLSPRTVGSHLYSIFPALNITSRNQLRDVLPSG